MWIRFLRSMTLLAFFALTLAACSNKEERYGASDSAGATYDSYEEDAPLGVSSGRSSARRSVRVEPTPAAAKTTSDVGTATSAPSAVTVTSARSVESGGGLGVRGRRASETSIRVDGIAVTDAVGTAALMSAAPSSPSPSVMSPGVVGSVVAGAEAVEIVSTSAVSDVVTGEATTAEMLSFDVDGADRGAKELKAADDDKTKMVEEDRPKPEATPRAGQLTAGEWSDLSNWNFWSSVNASNDWKHMNDYWGFGKGQRISVRVDNGHDPIPDAVATLLDKNGTLLWTARTDNFGRAELFTGLDKKDGEAPYQVVVRSAEKEARLSGIDPSREQSPSESPLVIRLAAAAPELKVIDLMFVVDATGSMGDELTYIKSELQSVIDRVRAEMGEEFVIRLSTNVYRDQGDEYVVRSHEFDEKIESAAEFLRSQSAGGGGDTPEAVDAALEDAVRNHAWSESAQSRFLFFVLDAPPHYDEGRVAKLRELTREAAGKGIRIIGVSGSGVDKETEFLMRNLGLHTGGTYVFLTDHSGIGGSHIEPTIGSYTVEYLDDLIVRLIVQYTARPSSLDAITERKPTLD